MARTGAPGDAVELIVVDADWQIVWRPDTQLRIRRSIVAGASALISFLVTVPFHCANSRTTTEVM
jgi:hypothetical protein